MPGGLVAHSLETYLLMILPATMAPSISPMYVGHRRMAISVSDIPSALERKGPMFEVVWKFHQRGIFARGRLKHTVVK